MFSNFRTLQCWVLKSIVRYIMKTACATLVTHKELFRSRDQVKKNLSTRTCREKYAQV
jgi:hypothetical protein